MTKMLTKVFIDGQAGTTGLKLFDRLQKREDIELLNIEESDRKNNDKKAEIMNSADFVFLCLPDKAAIESTALITNENVKIIDTSTAHRTNPDWTYGFPELSDSHRENIEESFRVATPGCYASGMLSLIYPLFGIIDDNCSLAFSAISGYSGGGKKMIAEYEDKNTKAEFSSPREYALTQGHKHLAEVVDQAGLLNKPLFMPYVCDFYSGMTVSLPLYRESLNDTVNSPKKLHEFFCDYYMVEDFIHVLPLNGEGVLENGFLAANKKSGFDDMEIIISGNEERLLLSSRFDNLGKGASGAAIQCMNIMLGIDEKTGLILAK